jgi:hypothetical protein
MAAMKYPFFREMEPGEERVIVTTQKKFSQYAYQVGIFLDRKFKTRRVGEGRIRVRRVA